MKFIQKISNYIAFKKNDKKVSLIQDHDITQEVLDMLVQDAQPTWWVVPNYIPQLEHIEDIWETIVWLRDATWKTLYHGNSKKIVSAQSTIKIILYAYALEKWTHRSKIAWSEAVWLPFNDDPITHGKTKTAAHPLNNAWWISSASEITDWDDFLWFVRDICANDTINILSDVYESEKLHRQNNLKLAASLAAAWRIAHDHIQNSLDYYTRASALWVHVDDMLNMWSILMLGWKDHAWNQVLQHNTVVRVINAMNSFWLYDATARMWLMHSGTRSLAAKSGVSWLVLFVNPYAGTYVTLGHHLDRQWNSAFGMQISAGLNELLSHGWAMRLDLEWREELMQYYEEDLIDYTQEEALRRLKNNTFCNDSFILSHMAIEEMKSVSEKEQQLISYWLQSCYMKDHAH